MRRFVPAAVTIACAIVFATVVNTYAAAVYVVPSGSMLPTLQINDRILVNKLSGQVHRGDIVVFHRAPGDHDLEYPVLVKRVIGLPGQTISSAGDTVLIDGKAIAQPWLPKLVGLCSQSALGIPPQRIPPGHYFVMGDCRGDSSDSRAWGTVPASYVIGKVVAVIWEHNHPWVHWF